MRRVGWHVHPDRPHMHVHNQPGSGAWSQSAGASKQASKRQEEPEGRLWHLRTDGSHMHVHSQPGGGAWSQSAGSSKQASERQGEEKSRPARAP